MLERECAGAWVLFSAFCELCIIPIFRVFFIIEPKCVYFSSTTHKNLDMYSCLEVEI